jgi:hypothetical protein
MKPPVKKMDYEKIATDDFVTGHIEDVLYDMEHSFKGFEGSPDETKPGVRLVFVIDGYKFPHKTGWMKFSYSSKSNLFKKYVSSLVKDAKEYMEFDLDQLKGMKVKMLWVDKDEYQYIETIRPVGEKVIAVKEPDESPI